jgi:hypothetical protein
MVKGNAGPVKKRFRWRVFVSFGLLWLFLAVALAGIVLYFRPEGTLASWTDWSFLGLDKKSWEGIHTILVVGLLVFSSLHVAFNGKALIGYLRRKASNGLRAKAEFGAAFLMIALLLVGAVGRWAPFWKVMDARSAIKQGSLAVHVPPPSPDAADRDLSDLCGGIPVSLEEARSRLERAGYPVVDAAPTLTRLSKKYGVSPERLYRIITGR